LLFFADAAHVSLRTGWIAVRDAVRLQVSGGPGTRDAPRDLGFADCSALPVERETRHSASPRSLSASLGQGNRFIPLPWAAPAACRSWLFGHDPWRSPLLGQDLSLTYAGAELRPSLDPDPWLHARNASRPRRRTAYDCPPATAMGRIIRQARGVWDNFFIRKESKILDDAYQPLGAFRVDRCLSGRRRAYSSRPWLLPWSIPSIAW